MIIEAVLRAARILKTQPGYTMPLARLHAQLVRELGPEAGTYRQIYQQLEKRADSFMVFDSARRLGGTEIWPSAVREEYNHALDDAGFGCCVRVTLTEAVPQAEADSLIAALNNTMAELLATSEQDPGLQDFVERATEQLAEFGRVMLAAAAIHPTTPPPDPPTAE
jgi:hypothetical protein